MLVFCIAACAGSQKDVSPEKSKNQSCSDGGIIKKAKNQKGTVYYNANEQRFAIYVSFPGFDSQDVGFICGDLDSLKDGLSVTFTGNYFSYLKDRRAPVGGQKYYFLEVKDLKIEGGQ